jgi:hypothetical protein
MPNFLSFHEMERARYVPVNESPRSYAAENRDLGPNAEHQQRPRLISRIDSVGRRPREEEPRSSLTTMWRMTRVLEGVKKWIMPTTQ